MQIEQGASSFSNNVESSVIVINPPKRQVTWTGFHAPPVETTGHSRSMSNCGDVREIYGQCLAQHSSDDMCKTAASYFSICKVRMGNTDEY